MSLPRTRTRSRIALAALVVGLLPSLGAAQSTNPGLPGCGVPAGTLASPFLGVIVNGACTDLSTAVRRTSETAPTWELRTSVTVQGGGQIDVQAAYDGDPFVTFGVTTTNLVAGPVSFSFLFGTPIVSGLYNTATSTAGLSLTSLAGAGTATVATSSFFPTFVSGYRSLGGATTNLGVNLGTTPCTAAAGTTTCNYGTAATTFAPVLANNLEALLTYSQTGLSSVASWSGGVTLTSAQTTVPEPTTIALTAIGLLATGVVARRRRTRC